MAKKTSLTAAEAIRAAYLKSEFGTEDHVLSCAFGVNQGRISEAVQAITWASENYKQVYSEIPTGWQRKDELK